MKCAGRLDLSPLRAAGVQRLFTEQASGGRWDRPHLHRLLDQLRPEDVVIVWKLDRLSRSLKDLLHIMERMASIMASATPFFFCTTQKHLAVKIAMISMA